MPPSVKRVIAVFAGLELAFIAATCFVLSYVPSEPARLLLAVVYLALLAKRLRCYLNLTES